MMIRDSGLLFGPPCMWFHKFRNRSAEMHPA